MVEAHSVIAQEPAVVPGWSTALVSVTESLLRTVRGYVMELPHRTAMEFVEASQAQTGAAFVILILKMIVVRIAMVSGEAPRSSILIAEVDRVVLGAIRFRLPVRRTAMGFGAALL